MSEETLRPPTTTAEENLHSASQRRINIIWEITQAIIALLVTSSVLYASVKSALGNDLDKTAFIFLTNIAFTIIGFYFGRTNHQRIGGVDLGR